MTNLSRSAAALGCLVALSGCATPQPEGRAPAAGVEREVTASAVSFRLAGLSVAITDELRVSEANRFYPIADIVWRGEPLGDRRAQIRSILADGAAKAMDGVTEGVPAVAEVEITRFHTLTEKARYSVGGVHSIDFIMTLRDPATNAALDGPREINADIRAAGGARAMAEDAAGRTQRVVIVEHLARVFRRELGVALPAPSVAPVPPVSGEVEFTPVDMTAD